MLSLWVFFFIIIVAYQDFCALIVDMLGLQGAEEKEGRKEGRFLGVPDSGRACIFLAELSEMNVNEDGITRERGKSK